MNKHSKVSILVFGDSNVGKSSILNSYCNLSSNNLKKSNIENSKFIDLYLKKVLAIENKFIVEFLEFSGNYEFDDLKIFLKLKLLENTDKLLIDAIIFIFDVNNDKTFKSYKIYFKLLYEYLNKFYKKNSNNYLKINKGILAIPCLFIGTKFEKIIDKNYFSIKDFNNNYSNKYFIKSVLDKYNRELSKEIKNFKVNNLIFIKDNDKQYLMNILDEYFIALFKNSKNIKKNFKNKFKNTIKTDILENFKFLSENKNHSIFKKILKFFNL